MQISEGGLSCGKEVEFLSGIGLVLSRRKKIYYEENPNLILKPQYIYYINLGQIMLLT